MLWLLLLIPALAGIGMFVIRWQAVRRTLLVVAAASHFCVTVAAWFVDEPLSALGGWLLLDVTGLLFLSIVSTLFFVTSVYAVGYLIREHSALHKDVEEGMLFTNTPEAAFIGCLLLFLATMTLVTMCQHMGLMWVAIEATTLASAPLIYFHRHHRSLEATWKYLLICSVGIALALLGNFFMALASAKEGSASLLISDLLKDSSLMDIGWLKAAFICLLVGYGTKMGLAPMHTWLPDAHSEAPSVVSALLSGALLNCAFLGIFRALQVCQAAGIGDFTQELLVIFGLVSIFIAAIFILVQPDFKRMLAYSSVEHMGILALGVGIGGQAVFGAMLHAINHSFAKAMLFLVAGNILYAYRSKAVKDVSGLLKAMPVSGILWIIGLLAITGYPPFGIFISKFIILKVAIDNGDYVVAAVFMGLLAMIFIGMMTVILGMAQGRMMPGIAMEERKETWSAVIPPAVFALLLIILGLYIPQFVSDVLVRVAGILGGI